jgi:hypothetical protein
MGRAVGLLIVLLLLAGVGVWLAFAGGHDAAPIDGPTADPHAPADTPAKGTSPAPAGSPTNGSSLISTAERDSEPTPARDLASAPSVFLQVFDRLSTQPVTGAAVYRYHGGELIDFTDKDGRCALPLKKEEQLAIVGDDYLLRLCPSRPGSTADLPQRVLLERDLYSQRCRFQFRRADGTRVDTVFARFTSDRQAQPGGSAQPKRLEGAAPEVQRAWLEHTMIASLQPFGHLHVQMAVRSSGQRHMLRGDDEVRFCEGGLYQFEVATMEGLVARGAFSAESITREPLIVTLEAGRFVQGTVVGADQKPATGAQITVLGGDPLQLMATTGTDGGFRIGPFGGGMVTLEVRHREHEPCVHGPIASQSDGVRIALQALPADTLRGRVRARPSLRPIAGATVSVLDATGQPVTAQSEADGTFRLRISGKETSRLAIAANGFVPYSELLEPGASGSLDFDLWPANAAVRVAERLTGLLRGVVVDEQGRPVSGIPVRHQPREARPLMGVPGRRILDGGALALPAIATSGNDGAFEIESMNEGPGVVFAIDGTSSEQDGIAVDLVLGQTRDGLRLQVKKRS